MEIIETGVLVGVKGYITTLHCTNMDIGSSVAIRPTVTEVGWYNLGKMGMRQGKGTGQNKGKTRLADFQRLNQT